MIHIEKPNRRTFWKIRSADGSVIHKGITEINQVTSTNMEIESQDSDPSNVFDPLPESGELKEGEIYTWDGKMVRVEQTHDRMHYAPDQTPALFTIERPNSEGSEWIAQERVIKGDTRTWGGVTYKCIQGHTTLNGWEPNKTPTLWKEVPEESGEVEEWVRPTGAHDVYNTGDRVLFEGSTYESSIDNNSWSPTEYPQGWTEIS